MAKQETRADYKRNSLPEKTQSERVTMWRKRIEQAKKDLMIPERVGVARESDRFLGGAKIVPTKGRGRSRVYLNYALPLLEELHRGSIPSVPTPMVEARTEGAAGPNNEREQATQRFMAFLFDKHHDEILESLNAIQWDDDKMGAAILRVDWKNKAVDANPVSDISQENVDVQVRKASDENADPTKQIITDSDLDITHLSIHEPFLLTMQDGSPDYLSMQNHIAEHNARLSIITQEGIRVERVRNDRYIYDQYHGWKNRGWEAELKFARVKFLIENKYNNVNPINAPPRQSTLDGSDGADMSGGELAYEDRTVAIWEIHDRLNQTELVLAADGPEDGLPLMERPWRYGAIDIYKLRPFHVFEPSLSWGEPLMHVLIPILERLAVVDYYIDKHVQNHAQVKTMVPSGAGSDKIKKALNDPNTRHVPVPPEMMGRITDTVPPPIPQTLLEDRALLIGELRRAVGLDDQDLGANRPGVISATESFNRATAGAGRIEDRQRVIAEFLGWVGETALKLYKDFAMMATEVSVNTEVGQEWTTIEPRDLPVDINISFDIEGITDKGRAEKLAIVDRVIAVAGSLPIPVDYDKLFTWAMKSMGIARPEQFRAQGAPGPENILDTKGQPGVEGSSQAPVGTAQNQEANAQFAPGPADAEAAAEASGQIPA